LISSVTYRRRKNWVTLAGGAAAQQKGIGEEFAKNGAYREVRRAACSRRINIRNRVAVVSDWRSNHQVAIIMNVLAVVA